jgi:hypothetical protein
MDTSWRVSYDDEMTAWAGVVPWRLANWLATGVGSGNFNLLHDCTLHLAELEREEIVYWTQRS